MKNLTSLLFCTFVLLWAPLVSDGSTGDPITQARHSKAEKVRKEYKFTKKTGKLSLDLGKAMIQGYKGDEVIISMMVEEKDTDERAAGLKGISGSGFFDNTDMGLHVSHKEDISYVRLIKGSNQDSISVKVPDNLLLTVNDQGHIGGNGNILIRDMKGEVEVSTTLGNVRLENLTGPLTVRTVNGNIEAILNTTLRGPISLLSTVGFIDLALPLKAKANLQMSTAVGNLYASDEFDIEVVPTNEKAKRTITITKPKFKAGLTFRDSTTGAKPVDFESMDSIINESLSIMQESLDVLSNQNFTVGYGTGNNVKGKINGGGDDVILRTTSGTIYLRTTAPR